MTTITAHDRQLFVGDFVSDKGGISLDVRDLRNSHSIYSSIPLTELLAALSKIPGVTATYEEPKPTTWEILQGLGDYAVVRFQTRIYRKPESFCYTRKGGGDYLGPSGLPLSEDIANRFNVIVEFEGIR